MKTIIDFTNKVKTLVNGRISNIANVEESPSTHPYTVGKQLIFNGLLCKATSAISVGDTLAVGTNLALADNVVEQIYSLNQGLTNSLANISHENLLDNPWFTVNQRGQSSYSSGYTVDRWKIGYGDVICNVTNDGITLSSSILGSTFIQFIEEDFYNKFIAGKYLTVSVLLTDGTIKSATGYAPVNTSYYQNAAFMYITNTCTLTVVGKTGENEQVQLRFAEANSDSVSIRAIKLELGSTSTLAMDTAPNYVTELMKCQRYFVRLKSSSSSITFPAYVQSTSGRATLQLPVAMRALPTITKTGTLEWVIEDNNNVQMSTITAVSDDNQFIILKEDNIFPSVTGYCIAILRTWTNATLDISADL